MLLRYCNYSIFETSRFAAGTPLIAMVLALSACVPAPDSALRQELKPVTSYATDKSFAAAMSLWPGDRWWDGFHDPQLATLITEGLADASDMRIAQARFAAARAAAGDARAALLPSVNLGSSVVETKSSYNSLMPRQAVPHGWKDMEQVTMDGSWTLDFWGRNRAGLHSAEAQAEAAHAEEQAARLMVSTGIAAAYADLATLYRERDAAEEARNVRNKTAALMTKRQGEGLENEGAVDRARSGGELAGAEIAAIDEQIAITRNQIAALIGAGPDRGLAIKRPSLPMNKGFGLPSSLPAELLGRRPDIVAARFRVEASMGRIDQAAADFYPNINLLGLIGLQSLGVDNLLLAGSGFGVIGPTLSLPIFDGERLRAQYRGAEAGFAEAVAVYNGTLTQALREVADAAASSRALAIRLKHCRAAEAEARAAWKIANNRYQGGLGNYLDVLTAEDALIQSHRVVASLEARAFTLDIALIRALGGGYQFQKKGTQS